MLSKNKNQRIFKAIFQLFGIMALLFCCYWMLQIILIYRTGETDVAFLLTKQNFIHLLPYRFAFYLHIFPSIFVLAAGLTQFSKFLLRKRLEWHRFIGKVYVFIVLVISAPAALVMSFYAHGGILGKIGFIILSLLWWYFTFRGFQDARKKEIGKHRQFMIRSYALTFSAISLRFYQFFLAFYIDADPVLIYVIFSWLSWVGNLLVVEIWIKKYPNWN